MDIKVSFKMVGGESDPRNKSLMKMFNLINIGERAGSDVPNIFNVWNDEGFVEPETEERFDPDRIVLTLSFVKKAIEKSDGKKVTKKREEQYEKILTFMQPNVWYKASDLMNVLGVKETRTKELLRALLADESLVDDGKTFLFDDFFSICQSMHTHNSPCIHCKNKLCRGYL